MTQFSNKKLKTIAYIDGQNIHLATTRHPDSPWRVDLARFRVYLREKYLVEEAYYWLGYVEDGNDALYDEIQKAGFILKFRRHNSTMQSSKKGNVDTEIVFEMMLRLYRKEEFDGYVLVSGDGDYLRLVEFLIEEKKLTKLLFPNRERASSLYRIIDYVYHDDLSSSALRAKIGQDKKKRPA